VVIRNRKWKKDGQHNGQTKRNKRTNYDQKYLLFYSCIMRHKIELSHIYIHIKLFFMQVR
jgi:hypothetical protein